MRIWHVSNTCLVSTPGIIRGSQIKDKLRRLPPIPKAIAQLIAKIFIDIASKSSIEVWGNLRILLRIGKTGFVVCGIRSSRKIVTVITINRTRKGQWFSWILGKDCLRGYKDNNCGSKKFFNHFFCFNILLRKKVKILGNPIINWFSVGWMINNNIL